MNGLLKKVIKSAVYRLASARNEDEISAKLKDKTVVSFDVFDTAVKRDVLLPTDIFALMEKKLADDKTLQIPNFASARIAAEKSAWSRSGGREITLADIYAQMPLTEEQRRCLMRLECETEIEASAPNIPIKRIYDACVREGKRVLFISDMYLPSQVIGEILRKNGYNPGHLYVSCEAGSNKSGGGLFSYVQKAEALKAESWVHIGDSIQGDFLAPKRLGIGSVLIERDRRYNKYVHKKLFRKSLGYRQLNHFIDTRLPRYSDPYERIGYAVLGPLLYGFSLWLEREIPRDNSIAFLAREGELLQKAFQIVSERPSAYLYISRHAANLAYLDDSGDPETVLREEALSIRHFGTQKELAKSFGLSDQDVDRAMTDLGLDENAIVYSQETERRVITRIWPVIKANVSGQHAMLQRYLEQLGLTDRCSVVDVGWHGSIQSLLDKSRYTVSGRDISWSGYYIGCIREKASAGYDNIEKKGFLFDGDSDKYQYEGVRNSAPFFELLFLSTEGTTTNYASDAAGGIIPVHSRPENTGRSGKIIASLQAAGVRFVEDIHNSPARTLIAMDAEVSGYNYQSLARVPSLSTLSMFGRFNSYNEYLYCLGGEHHSGYYLLHPKEFFHEFTKKPGKTWFLKDVFKLPLPYIQMVRLARALAANNKSKG